MLETDESVAHIDSNVFVGSLEGAEDRRLLERLGISSILTVDTHRPRVSASMKCFMIEITDEETSDLLSHLDEAVQFIQDCLREGGGGVLVHCRHGVSRSVSVTAAWLLHSGRGSSVPAVLEIVARRRPQARPNDGFISQLELYHRLGCQLVKHDPRYINFALQHNQPHQLKLLCQSPESISSGQPSQKIRCSKCRKILTYRHHIINHTAGKFPHWTQAVVTTNNCLQGFFVTDLTLLTEDLISPGEPWDRVSKLECKYCKHKIGNWGLPSCGCGARGGRGIWLNSSKVDV